MNEIFKTEFKGYSKKEVADYIMQLNEQMESLKGELDRAENELERYKGELNENESVTREPSEDELAAIREEITASVRKELTEKLSAQYQASLISNDQLDALRAKADLYDSQKEIIAELMIKAKADAAEIYSDAESRAKKLMLDAFDRFTKLQSDFDVMKKNVEASKADIDSRIVNIRRSLDDFTQYLGFMSQDINNTADNFKQDI